MRGCLDEGILQSYLDGELSRESMEGITSHLASCLTCSATAHEMQGQNSLVATALAPEFDLSVPTERLRHRIDAAVAGRQVLTAVQAKTSSGVHSWFRSFSDLFSLSPQRTLVYAGLIVVLTFATVLAVVEWRHAPALSPNYTAATESKGDPNKHTRVTTTASPEPGVPEVRLTAPPTSRIIARKNRPVKTQLTPGNQQVARVKLMPGERSYLKTIAALDSAIRNARRPMRPALQAEYERNLAVVDRALAATRTAAKNNPNDLDAAEFMFAAYQSKVDLLNTVADARLYNREH